MREGMLFLRDFTFCVREGMVVRARGEGVRARVASSAPFVRESDTASKVYVRESDTAPSRVIVALGPGGPEMLSRNVPEFSRGYLCSLASRSRVSAQIGFPSQ